MDIILFIIGVLLLIGLVVVHELGHAIAARRNGVVVDEFGIGFPPAAWARKLKNGMRFSVNWLPIGGFVKLKGEHDSAKGPGTYGSASLWVKAKILMAGVVVNWLVAVLIFTVLALAGMPKILPDQFAVAADNHVSTSGTYAMQVSPDSPAERAGIKPGDELVTINGQAIASAHDFSGQTSALAGQTVPVTYKQDGQTHQAVVTLNQHNNGEGFIGIGLAEQTTQRATWSAPIVGAGVTIQFTYETFKGLFTTIANLFQTRFAEAGANVAGPVGIVSILMDSSSLGVVQVLFLIGIISLTLAVINVLPIPALDGGRLFVTLLFRALRKPLTKQREESIQIAGFAVIMALVIIITIVDVRRFF